MSSQVTQSKVKAFAVNNTMLFFAVILFAACMIGVPRFATGGNLMNILIQVSINALIACGMTFVILSDGIDLSVGSVAAIAGVAGASLIKQMPDAGIVLWKPVRMRSIRKGLPVWISTGLFFPILRTIIWIIIKHSRLISKRRKLFSTVYRPMLLL